MTLLTNQKLVVKEKVQYTVYKITPHQSSLNSTSRKIQASLFELFSYKHPKYPWQRGGILSTFKKGNMYISMKDNPKFWWIVKMYGESDSLVTDDEDIDEEIIVQPKATVQPPPEVQITKPIPQSLVKWDLPTIKSVSTNSTINPPEKPKPILLQPDVTPEPKNVEDANLVKAQPETYQRIEFYVAVPNEFKEAFRTKFDTHVQWRKSTLKEVKEGFEFPEVDNTDMYNMKYTRNDMFSLDFDYKEQETPIRDIMSVSRELRGDEAINLFVQTESVNRKKWKKLVDYSWEVWDKGKVPSRPGLDPKMLSNDVLNLAVLGLYELKSILDDILHGVTKSFFNDKTKEAKHTKPLLINSERESILIDGELKKPTKMKRNRPVFNTNIVYTVTSEDTVKRDMLSRSMSNSLMELNGDNILKPVKVTYKPKKEIKKLQNWQLSSLNSNKMSVDEVGKIMQLPTADLQKDFVDSLLSNKRTEIELDKELLKPSGILAGTATLKGKMHKIYVQTTKLDMTSTARAIIGSPRMGKDQYVINYIVEAKKTQNIGAFMIEVINENNGHRGMGDAVRDHLPPEDVIEVNLLDTDNPIYLGLEPIIKGMTDLRIAGDRIAEELASFLLTDGDEDKFQTSEYLRDAAKFCNADILAIKHMLTSDSYRAKILKEKEHLYDTSIWDEYNKMTDGKKQAIYAPVMRRIGQIYSSEFLRPILCQTPNTKLDLYNLILEGKVIIFRMKAGVMSQRAIETLSHWLLLLAYLIKLIQGGDVSKSNGMLLVLNEPDMYLTKESADFVTRVFTQGPKYRITPVLIFHHFQKLAHLPGFVKKMKSSSLNWHLFRNTNDDIYKEMMPYLSNTFETAEDAFQATKKYQFIGIWLNSDGSYYDPFVADSLPMVGDRYTSYDNSHLILEHSKKFGTPIEKVLADIKARNKEALKPVEDTEESKKGAKKSKQ
jgi:hypothetical protein